MIYSIRHSTRFKYARPADDSIMELRLQPRTEGPQRCLSFRLSITPRANVFSYRDYLGNSVHHFDIRAAHRQLVILSDSVVEQQETVEPPLSLAPGCWEDIDRMAASEDYWEMLTPSHYVQMGEVLDEVAGELRAERRDDPMTLLRELNTGLFGWLAYVKKTTRVDSPVDDALRARAGVCQDYAHIMIGVVRRLGIPCRYVSGYLFPGETDRSGEGATHAWVEALLPELGWVGFDPTNNLVAGIRHVRTAIGRDYSDVPPTRGVFKGTGEGELSVSVRVTPSEGPIDGEPEDSEAERFRMSAGRTLIERQQQGQ